ncbi:MULTISPECIES: YggS family pyridoxal phosphate-dependent enzyme [unclassified Acinetobacter]|uniref:YggS family pyridoxal phosphate-dependent enzyme n=1 Tax=unclassified Acinetobacter TaxID=196816 RepID=UPI00190CA43B|nr:MULTISPECIES: YggS family pyridoxal phosphate-dependent enzyme [unclassified Acinetobacter]MBK0064967.1 YggS family pyridoxal phosphate-dependent enzyme [Acinetobacter sp. S55]MBK0067342.1 YggS family pyridoxal phosphate-dependent enzyme [Acinetobacter sp. S54]
MNQFQQARNQVLDQIKNACQMTQRDPSSVHLLAVSKTHPSQALRDMYQLGQRCFGENYLQEALDKIEELNDLEIQWHFIGHVQRNKTKHLAEKFDWVHGVDRLIIAERLSSQRLAMQQPLNLCLQVNIDAQQSKDGCRPDEVAELVKKITQLPHIRLRGLMVIPAPDHEQAFLDAKKLFDEVKIQHHQPQDWDTLSMGMSADLEAAIAAGATIVRIGTALFGTRDYLK